MTDKKIDPMMAGSEDQRGLTKKPKPAGAKSLPDVVERAIRPYKGLIQDMPPGDYIAGAEPKDKPHVEGLPDIWVKPGRIDKSMEIDRIPARVITKTRSI